MVLAAIKVLTEQVFILHQEQQKQAEVSRGTLECLLKAIELLPVSPTAETLPPPPSVRPELFKLVSFETALADMAAYPNQAVYRSGNRVFQVDKHTRRLTQRTDGLPVWVNCYEDELPTQASRLHDEGTFEA